MRTLERQAIRGSAARQHEHSLPAPAARPSLPPPPFLVAGLGRAGRAAISALRRLVPPELLYCWDASTGEPVRGLALELRGAGIRTWLGAPPPLDGPLQSCAVVKSPGIPFSAPLIRRAQELGMEVLDELELGWRLSRVPVVAVTGTNGKSTVCALLSAIARAGGLNAALAGNSQFAPPLSEVATADVDVIVCETSSFQLEGCSALLPEAAVLTNVRPEHMNRHGTFDAYAACKRRLFVRGDRATPRVALNLDDDVGGQLFREVRERGVAAAGYGRAPAAEFRLRRLRWTLASGWLEMETPDGAVALRSKLPGPHNAVNVAGAVAAARSLGFELETIVEAIERTPGVPGRFERIEEGQPFDVIVDFAHTPDAVSAVIATARAIVRRRRGARLHVLVSVAGHRTRELSAPIGQAVARFADRVVLTEGSSLGEPRGEVLAPLIEGARSVGGAGVEVVPDRRDAIRRVLAFGSSGDVVLVLGRGALPRLFRHANDAGVPFDDREVVRATLRELCGRLGRKARGTRATR